MTLLPLLFALAHPLEVLEEWEVVSESPLVESVTTRGVYRRADGPQAVLPDAVQRDARPSVFAPGVQTELVVRRGPQGWEVDLPPGQSATVRLVARISRPLSGVRLFKLDWPPAVAVGQDPATRRVAMVYRDWIVKVPSAWNCPDDFAEVATCVSTTATAPPLTLRVPPPRASRAALAGAALALLAAFIAGALLGPKATARARLAGALGGAFVGACVALALVGARSSGWAAALLEAAVPAALVGTLAVRNEGTRAIGAVALFVVPLLVVFDGRLTHVLGAAGVSAAGLLALALRPASPINNPDDGAPGASSDSPNGSSPPPPPASDPSP